MTLAQEEKDIAFAQSMQKELTVLNDFEGFSMYQKWREVVFGIIGSIIEKQDKDRLASLRNLGNFFDKEISLLADMGVFHESYLHNLQLSVEIFALYWNNQTEQKRLLDMLDIYVKPKSVKTQDFKNSIDKAASAIFTYMLSQYDECSEHIALHIAKQAFGFGSEQTVYEGLQKLKQCALPNNKIPMSAKFMTYLTLLFKSPDWEKIEPRAKHERSISELKKALKCVQSLREKVIEEELLNAQNTLLQNRERFEDILIQPSFIDDILKFRERPVKIDDEMTCAVLCASFFGSNIKAALLPPEN